MRRLKLGIWSNRGSMRERKSSARPKGVKRSPDFSEEKLARSRKRRRERQLDGFKKMSEKARKRILRERRKRKNLMSLLFTQICLKKS